MSDEENQLSEFEEQRLAEEKKVLLDAHRESIRSFDKAMLTLPAGALGLSLVFISDLVPDPAYKVVLGASWLLFTAAILTTLISFLTSSWAIEEVITEIDAEIYGEKVNGQLIWSERTNRLNKLSICLFIAGVIGLLMFAFINL